MTELPLSGPGVAALTNECGSTSLQPTAALGAAVPGMSVACRVQSGSPAVSTVSTTKGVYLDQASRHQVCTHMLYQAYFAYIPHRTRCTHMLCGD